MDAKEPRGAAASVRVLRTRSEQKLCDPTGLPNTRTPSWVRGRPSGSSSPSPLFSFSSFRSPSFTSPPCSSPPSSPPFPPPCLRMPTRSPPTCLPSTSPSLSHPFPSFLSHPSPLLPLLPPSHPSLSGRLSLSLHLAALLPSLLPPPPASFSSQLSSSSSFRSPPFTSPLFSSPRCSSLPFSPPFPSLLPSLLSSLPFSPPFPLSCLHLRKLALPRWPSLEPQPTPPRPPPSRFWRMIFLLPPLPPFLTSPPAPPLLSCSAPCSACSLASRLPNSNHTRPHPPFPLPSLRLPSLLRLPFPPCTAAPHSCPHLRCPSHWRANIRALSRRRR
ncbi:unnamed protein product [Closterium sp. NIES-65]|nr:unnamed protein product [Closterium sp. NIES-65]